MCLLLRQIRRQGRRAGIDGQCHGHRHLVMLTRRGGGRQRQSIFVVVRAPAHGMDMGDTTSLIECNSLHSDYALTIDNTGPTVARPPTYGAPTSSSARSCRSPPLPLPCPRARRQRVFRHCDNYALAAVHIAG